MSPQATLFAPAERAPEDVVRRQADAVRGSKLLSEVLAAVPDLLLVLNPERQIVFANRALGAFLAEGESAVGLRPGEVLRCANAPKGPGGCGTSEACRTCGLVLSLLALVNRSEVEKEARLTLESGANLDLRVRAHTIEVDGERLSVAAVQDIADEKRRKTLERLFFHDVLNTAGGVQGLAGMLKDAAGDQLEPLADLLESSAEQLVEEIRAHRVLVAAEDGDYHLDIQQHGIAAMVQRVVDRFRSLTAETGVRVVVGALPPSGTIRTDAVLAGRILGNLIKNAIEASRPEEEVTVSASLDGDAATFAVHNPSVMPRETQLQVFQRSYSTKGVGRGLGTYSIRLFAERYLGGNVSFRSEEGAGTTFTVRIPGK